MCGICGEYRPEGARRDVVERMMAALIHRGPDDEGSHFDGPAGLGHRRLSIIDLDGGRQPIANEDETIWVVCNGEIYNYRELREGLKRRGHTIRSRTDTEVIVHLYEEMGESCVEMLDGMFAFALWDRSRRKLLLARDRLGQKPLFYARQGQSLLFGSELKALLASGEVRREIDLEALHHYFSLRFIPAPLTMMKGVRKLPPAHTLSWQDGAMRLRPYWSLDFRDKVDGDDESLGEMLDEQLKRSVDSHLVSDVPVGAFLSGGMDSSMIVALMARHSGGQFPTFAIGVAEQDFDESPYARMVSEHCGTQHFEKQVQAELISGLPRMITHLDEPSDTIAACFYHSAALAAQHVKVALGGDGGDELFGGFDRYLGVRWIDSWLMVPSFLRLRLLDPLLRMMPERLGYKSTTQKLRWLQEISLRRELPERYATATTFFRFDHAGKREIVGDETWRQVKDIDSNQIIADAVRGADSDDPLDRMLHADYMTRLPDHSLMLTDRMSMAHGLEVRAPYLDHHLVELLARFPSTQKIRRRTLKYSLRRMGRRYLPPTIVSRPKQGFMFPVGYWFQDSLYRFLERFMDQAITTRNGILKPEGVARLIDEHRRRRNDHHVRIWLLLNCELWYRMYIEGEDVEQVEQDLARML